MTDRVDTKGIDPDLFSGDEIDIESEFGSFIKNNDKMKKLIRLLVEGPCTSKQAKDLIKLCK
jgi:hypothetical protein